MYYIKLDIENGNILGLDIKDNGENWFECAKEVYDRFKGQNLARHYINNFDEPITIDKILEKEVNLEFIKDKKKEQALYWYIQYKEFGVEFNDNEFSFKLEDEIYYNQLKNIDSEIYLIKNKEKEIIELSKEEFNILYNKLLYNKIYQEVYYYQYCKYIDSLKKINIIQKSMYESLPNEYIEVVKKMANKMIEGE